MKRGFFLLILTLFLISILLFVSIFLPIVSATWNSDLNNGLISYYNFNETVGTKLVDVVAGKHNGTLIGMNGSEWVSGILGNALSFDGIDDWVNISHSTDFNLQNYTINIWVSYNGTGDDEVIIKKGGIVMSQKDSFAVLIPDYSSKAPNYYVGNTAGDDWVTYIPGVGLTIGKWEMLTMKSNSTQAVFYINGSAVGTDDTPGFVNNNWDILLGIRNLAMYRGMMDELGIWNRSLTDDEVSYLWANGNGISYEPTEEEIVSILSISYETPITLNGGTTKEIYILFNTSNELFNDTTAQITITNDLESRTSNSCSNISNEYNCSITMQFYDSAGSWNINASIEDDEANLIENSTESFIVNELNYVTQDLTSINWASLTPNTNDNEASNSILFTNGGNQDYSTCNLKAYDIVGDIYFNLISASQFSVDNTTNATTGQIYLQNNTNIDISSKINLNTHSNSSTTQAFFYIDVPIGLKADTYQQLNSWEISYS